MRKVLVTEGIPSELVSRQDELYDYESAQPEWTPFELHLNFGTRPTWLDSAAGSLENQMIEKGVEKASDEPYVEYTDDGYKIRWMKGAPWLIIIIGLLIIVGLILAIMIGWKLYKFVKDYLGLDAPLLILVPAAALLGWIGVRYLAGFGSQGQPDSS